jgi:outer membrane protein OmpA-like peptidoglycan-associated protein
MIKYPAVAASFLVLAGCAMSTGISLFPGEKNQDGVQNPTGAVVVLDPGAGTDIKVIDQANSKSGINGTRVSVKAVSPETLQAKYGDLLDTLPSQPKPFLLYFKTGSTELVDPTALDRVFAEIKARAGADVQIVGHTDTTGDDKLNERVSGERAEAIKALLVSRGLDAALVRTAGRGERELLVKTADNVDNAENRRVEIIVR